MVDIIQLPAHERMKSEEALAQTLREAPPEVLILFFDAEGTFGVRSSGMSRKDALWLVELARNHVLSSGLDEDD